MKNLLNLFDCTLLISCGSDPESETECAMDSIAVSVCAECGDEGGCDEYATECRAWCEGEEDCQQGEVCLDTDEGRYCEVEYPCD